MQGISEGSEKVCQANLAVKYRVNQTPCKYLKSTPGSEYTKVKCTRLWSEDESFI